MTDDTETLLFVSRHKGNHSKTDAGAGVYLITHDEVEATHDATEATPLPPRDPVIL